MKREKMKREKMNETFRKVAQAIAVKSVSALAAKHFEGLQYGISVEGGAEILCHRISAGIKQKKILVALDAKNAFNTPWRRAIALELKRNFFFFNRSRLLDKEHIKMCRASTPLVPKRSGERSPR